MKIYPHEDMPLDELCEHLSRAAWIWFKNADILLLEELIRRARKAGATPGDDDGKRKPVRDIPGPAGADVRRQGGDAGKPPGAGTLTQEEIAQIEAYGRGAFASLPGSGETET